MAARVIVILALCVSLLLLVQGIVGLVLPDRFVGVVRFVQTPPVIYAAAAFRVAVGFVLFGAASASRMPTFLRIFGALVVAGGVLTPFLGIQFAELILGWWSSQGPVLVRLFAGVSLALSFFIAYAVAPTPRNA
ncbi:MAG: hypothetical protein M3Q89_00620 [Verrucomicrobiota bacterium]|nr:hypothetical protein [Verrucomicrobiota bacterium]